MEIESGDQIASIRIPLSGSDDFIELFVDELEDDTRKITSVLFDECVPPQYWIQIAVLISMSFIKE